MASERVVLGSVKVYPSSFAQEEASPPFPFQGMALPWGETFAAVVPDSGIDDAVVVSLEPEKQNDALSPAAAALRSFAGSPGQVPVIAHWEDAFEAAVPVALEL